MGEFLKDRLNCGLPHELYFWRDNHGHEIDLLRHHGAHLDAIEVKAAVTPSEALTRGLRQWARQAGDLAGALTLVTGGDGGGSWSGVRLLGWRELARITP